MRKVQIDALGLVLISGLAACGDKKPPMVPDSPDLSAPAPETDAAAPPAPPLPAG